MKDSRKRKLRKAGWKLGSVEEFLQLSPEEAELIEIKLALADAVREKRVGKHMTQHELADVARSSQSRVAKMEAGDGSVSIDLLVRTLLALNVSRAELGRLISRRSRKRARPA